MTSVQCPQCQQAIEIKSKSVNWRGFFLSFVSTHGKFSGSKFFSSLASVVVIYAYCSKEVFNPQPLNIEVMLAFSAIFITTNAVSLYASYRMGGAGSAGLTPSSIPLAHTQAQTRDTSTAHAQSVSVTAKGPTPPISVDVEQSEE